MSVLTTILWLWAIWMSGVQQSPGSTVIAASGGPGPNLESNIGRPLRYRPDGNDFVIGNGCSGCSAFIQAPPCGLSITLSIPDWQLHWKPGK